jgi:hypothetical protein
MLQVGNTLVSLDLIEKQFVCNLSKCKGACCVQGDSGAPLEDEEVELLESEYPKVKPYLRDISIETIEKNGKWQIDSDGDKVTTLVDNKECVFVVFEKGVATCAIEKAYFDGKTNFRKPVSCHLYPVRLTKYSNFVAVNYHEWDVCKPATKLGSKLEKPLFVFLKEALVRKFGNEWYDELELSASEYLKYKQQQQQQ